MARKKKTSDGQSEDNSKSLVDPSTKAYIDDAVGATVSKRLKNKQIVAAIEAPVNPLKPMQDAQKLSVERQSNAQYHHLPNIGIRPAQLANQVNSYITSLNAGVFYSVAQFVDAILEDESVAGTLSVRLQSLVSSRIDIIPASEDPRALEVRDLAQKHFPLMISNPQISELMRWGLMLGVALANVYMDETDGYHIPKVKIWHPRNIRYDWGFRELKLITENVGEVFLLHDDPSWMIVEPFGDFYPWMRGMIKPLANLYLKRHWAAEWWARHQEAAGSPMIGAVVPPNTDPADEELFVQAISERGFSPVVRLPQGQDGNRYNLEIIQASADLYKGFKEMLSYYDAKMEVLMLGQTYSTSGAQGLSSLENPGRAIRQEIRRHDARAIEPIIVEKLLKPWTIANFGDPALCPTLRFDIEDKEDQLQKSKTIQTLMDSFNKAGFRHVPLDIKAILNDFDLPIADLAAPVTSMAGDTAAPIPGSKADAVEENEEEEGETDVAGGGVGGDEKSAAPGPGQPIPFSPEKKPQVIKKDSEIDKEDDAETDDLDVDDESETDE